MPVAYGAFSPCQITGFFRIRDEFSDLARKGSTGAGVNIEQGVTTRVFLERAHRTKTTIFMNGTLLERPLISKAVVKEYLRRTGGNWHIRVFHRCLLPLGVGYGTSGAGAASLSLALNRAFRSRFDRQEALRVAHTAEVNCKTGLGTVASVASGGLSIRVTPGAPGIAEVRKIRLSRSLRVVSGSFGPISKTQVLTDGKIRHRINQCGRGLLAQLLKKPDETTFLQLSRTFAECSGLLTPRVRKVLSLLQEEGALPSMQMIGEAAFSIVHEDITPTLVRIMRIAGLTPFVSRIANSGAKPL